MISLLHIPISALIVLCLTYSAAAFLPLWGAWFVAAILTLWIGYIYEIRGNRDIGDLALDMVGLILGTLIVIWLKEHWTIHAGFWWIAPLAILWIFGNALHLFRRLK